ncbi:ScpA family protein [Streptomyces sp. B3I8]|uniref:segregation and condensation protein A n=1 Tax=Streptomyces sp. B3I8 TaxID=3042303 RepID=UPI002785DAC1|nr:segregation/condensation protein A [Streptomyces sp. B3I8]MDQ0786169.1 segregation and condensation protein A [Streptomyces sp. B3I8]
MTPYDTPRGRRRALGQGPPTPGGPPSADPETPPAETPSPEPAAGIAPAADVMDAVDVAPAADAPPPPEELRADPTPAPEAPRPSRPDPADVSEASAPAPAQRRSPDTAGRRDGNQGDQENRADRTNRDAPEAGREAAASDGVFTVRLVNFEGPFDLLLQLISRHKLDVTEVALSKVTDEFMAHIRGMGTDWDLDRTTEFLVVAATLLDLKAARLLPTAEVEDEADLALLEARDLLFARLLQYRAYKQIAGILHGRAEAETRRYPRTVGLEPHHAELLPDVVISIGPEGFARLAVKAMQPKPRPQVYVDHIHAPLVSVREQADVVVARLRELGEASFRVLVEDIDDTLTVVARFLALLELYREKAVVLEQESALGELLVRWTGGDDGRQPAVTDEFDRPPERRPEEENPAGNPADNAKKEEKT